jgi:hypothetical protein
MINAAECRAHSADCKLMGKVENISIKRAAILRAMARTWATLANQKDRFDDIVTSEARRPF